MGGEGWGEPGFEPRPTSFLPHSAKPGNLCFHSEAGWEDLERRRRHPFYRPRTQSGKKDDTFKVYLSHLSTGNGSREPGLNREKAQAPSGQPEPWGWTIWFGSRASLAGVGELLWKPSARCARVSLPTGAGSHPCPPSPHATF